eukprot:UN28036
MSKTKSLASISSSKSLGSYVEETYDAEYGGNVLELNAPQFYKTSICFPDSHAKFVGTPFPIFVCHLKSMDKFTAIELDVCDDTDEIRKIRACNGQSVCRLIENVCCIPMKLKKNWNYIVWDLDSLLRKIFKTGYQYCVRIRILA